MIPKDKDIYFDSNNEVLLLALQNIFECKNCGNCCREQRQIVLIPDDIKKIAKYLNTSYKKVRIKYVDSLDGILYLKSRPCIFYDGEKCKCKIYEGRPIVCRGYPFLTFNIDIKDGAVPALDGCPGSQEAARKFTYVWNKIIEKSKEDSDVGRALSKELKALKERSKYIDEEQIKRNMAERLRTKYGLNNKSRRDHYQKN